MTIRLVSYLNTVYTSISGDIREVSYFGALFGGLVGALFGGLDGFLKALIVFMVIDYITGVMVAWQLKKLSSSTGFLGLRRKGTILLLVILGTVVDKYILQNGQVVRTAVIFTYISNEGISILENCSNLGLPIPQKLSNVLEQLNDAKNKDDDKGVKEDEHN